MSPLSLRTAGPFCWLLLGTGNCTRREATRSSEEAGAGKEEEEEEEEEGEEAAVEEDAAVEADCRTVA